MAKAATKKTSLRKKARNKQGNYIADDPGVSNNEAYKKETSTESYIGIGLALLLIALVVLS